MVTQTKRDKPIKQQRQVDRRQLIIEAAIPIIGQSGYYGFSIRMLAEACGLTVPGILHHFGSKEALLLAVLNYRGRRDFEAVWQSLPFDEPEKLAAYSLSEVKRLLRETVLRNSRQPEMVRLVSVLRTEALYPGHPAFAYFNDMNQRSLAAISNLLTGKVPHPDLAAVEVAALLLGLESLWLNNPDTIDLVDHWGRGIERLLG